ncbi:uncharacterized protein METZ01_LOCUS445397 [marine metagenome]|uniref:Uncharacterized protein n=1 Tax=marine metagenome TaxID=408172 RepID=A0A382ZAP3_9ZZZZ
MYKEESAKLVDLWGKSMRGVNFTETDLNKSKIKN